MRYHQLAAVGYSSTTTIPRRAACGATRTRLSNRKAIVNIDRYCAVIGIGIEFSNSSQ